MKQLLLRFVGAMALLFLFSNQLFSQGQSTTQGKDFWLSYGQNYQLSPSDNMLQLRVVATKPTTVTLTFTLDGTTETFNVAAGQVYTRTFNASEAAKVYSNATGTSNKTLHITSNELISVFAISIYQATTDATNVLPATNYGKAYRHMSYRSVSGTGDGYTLVAIEDNTQIKENDVVLATLNKGQVYSKYVTGGDMTGTLITSDKPIAYFTTNSCVNVPQGAAACDCLFQQQVPVHSWGSTFLVPVTRRGKERIRVVASQDGTTITQTGATIISSPGTGSLVNLKAGQFVELEAVLSAGGCYIQSDKPVAVASFLTGTTYSGLSYALGDPAMAWVPPIEQTVMNVALAPFVATGTSVLKEHHALIVTPTATREATTMTIGAGVPKALSGGTWTENAASGFSFYSIPLTDVNATYYFENAAGLSVMGYGLGAAESYYYLAASSARQLNPAFYINDIHFEDANEQTYCAGEFKVKGVAQLQLQSGSGAITWFVDGQERTDARDKLEWTIQSLPLDVQHEIKMVVKTSYNETMTLTTKITVVNPQKLKITGDRFICPPAQSVTLKAGDGPARYQWYLNGNPITGATQKEWTVTRQNAGKYTVIGYYGTCQSPLSDETIVVDGCNATLNVTYNGNGSNSGTVPTDEKSPYVDNAEVTVKGLGDLKRTDATFIGWSFTQKQGVITAKSDEPTDLKKENDKFTIKTDTTLYATWAVDKKGPNGQGDNVPDYLQNGVTYNGNHSTSGAAPTDDNLYNANTQVEVKDSGSLVRTGAAFVGWSFTQKELIKKASDVPSDLKTKGQNFTITQDTTLFAVWGEDKTGPNGTSDGIPDYLQKGLTYNGNNQTSGDAPVDNNRYNSGTSVAVKDSGTMVRTEAVFLGWSFAQKGLITQAADEPADLKKTGAHFNITADTTLFAVWAIDKTGPGGTPDGKPDYSQAGVTYKGNDNTGGTAPVDSKLYNDNDDVKVLDKGDLVRTDAVFLGWLFEQKPLITKKADVPATIYQKDATFKYSANQKTLFALWGEDKTGPNGQSDNVPDYLQNGVTYNGNNQSSGAAPVDANRYNNGENVTVKDSGSLVRTQAVFIGWSFMQKPVITKAADEPADLKKKGATFASTSDTTLYAVWAIDKTGPNGTPDGKPDYSQDGVTYYANGGTGDAPTDNSLYNDNDEVTAKDKGTLAHTEAVFIGWLFNSHALVTKAADVPTGLKQAGDKFNYSSTTNKLYAIWGQDKTGPNGNSDNIPDYLQKGVTYDGNENSTGTAPTDNKRYNNNDAVTVLGKNDLTRDKAAFVGWSFGKKSLLTTKAEHDAVTDLKKEHETFNITTDTTLFAVWGKDETGPAGQSDNVPDYLQNGVTYNGNNQSSGVAPVDANRYNNGENVTVKDSGSLARTEAVFIGWSFTQKPVITKAADEPADLKKKGATFAITADTTLYAVWAVDKTGPSGTPDGKPDYSQDGVTYHANGASGTAPQDANLYNNDDQVTIKDKGDLTLNQTVFIGWHTSNVSIVTTAANVPADMKQPNQQVSYSSALANLYAVWGEDKTGPNGQSDNVPDYLQKGVTYDANGATGTVPTDPNRYQDSTMVTVKDKGNLALSGTMFIGWTFQSSDPSRITTEAQADAVKDHLIQPGAKFLIRNDVTLYAVWADDANGNGIPDYEEIQISWHPGIQIKAGSKIDESVSKKSPVKFTSKGYAVRGYVLIGWSHQRKPIVSNQAAENKIHPLLKVGDTLTVTAPTTFYAVWAIDSNNDGVADYKGKSGKLYRAPLLRGTSEDQIDQTESQLEAAAIRVWAHEGVLYIESDRRARAEVYTRSGALYKRIDVAEGQTREPLAEGFYVVVIDGKTHKVIVK